MLLSWLEFWLYNVRWLAECQLLGRLWFIVVLISTLGMCAHQDRHCWALRHQGNRDQNSCHISLRKDQGDQPLTWTKASRYCTTLGGKLAENSHLGTNISHKTCTREMAGSPGCAVECKLPLCPPGLFEPPACDRTCHCRDLDACDIFTGLCMNGKCVSGFFDPPLCQSQCRCKFDLLCNVTDGRCPRGCKEGWSGKACQHRQCPPGRAILPDCRHRCHCADEVNCDVVTGECPGICAQGWHGDKCEEKICDPSDQNCTDLCICTDEGCDGECSQSHVNCPPGWRGKDCNIRMCPFGSYGPPHCKARCYCQNDRFCSPIDGDCNGMPCIPGRAGPRCTEGGCPVRLFNPPACDKRCFCKDYVPCSPENGTCPTGCHDGWTGTGCNKRVCPDNKFGYPLCKNNCHCVIPEACNPLTGDCDMGPCEEGWTGHLCGASIQTSLYSAHSGSWVILLATVGFVVLPVAVVLMLQWKNVKHWRSRRCSNSEIEIQDSLSWLTTVQPAEVELSEQTTQAEMGPSSSHTSVAEIDMPVLEKGKVTDTAYSDRKSGVSHYSTLIL